MSSSTTKPLTVALGAAIATGTLVAGSLFSMQAIAGGYMQSADAGSAQATKAAEGQCGEGKCGGAMKPAAAKQAHEGGCGVAKMDTDKDGRISRAEFAVAHDGSDAKFAAHDGNGDGFISQAEMDSHHAAMKPKGDAKAATEGKCGEGKCGEGKCGGSR